MCRARQKLANVVAGLLVACATAIAFLPVLQAGFVNWDDYENLLQNPRYRGLNWSQLRWMFSTFHTGPYQPLSWMSLATDYFFWGLDPFGYHLTNLVLHVVNAVLFYCLSVRILLLIPRTAPLVATAVGEGPPCRADQALMSEPPGITSGWRVMVAASATALFFSIHPLRVESVAWVTQRRDVLCGFFLLCTLHSYLAAASSESATQRWRWLSVSLAASALSLLSKAISMTLPLVLLLLDAYPLRRLTWNIAARKARLPGGGISIWLEKVPFFILAFIAGTLAVFGQHVADALETLSRHGVPARISQANYGLTFYLWKTIFPMNLIPLYPWYVAFLRKRISSSDRQTTVSGNGDMVVPYT